MIHSAHRVIGTAAIACSVGFAPLVAAVSQARASAFTSSTSRPRSSLVDLSPCTPSALSRPFVRWWDQADYELVPGGDFETSGWTWSGEAQLAAGSEPYAVTGTLGHESLALPAGASAQSPLTCVDAAYPSIRFFITGYGAVALSLLDDGLEIPAGIATAWGHWQPTPVMLTESPVLATLSGGTALVSLRVTAIAGDPRIDDVYMDPWCRGG